MRAYIPSRGETGVQALALRDITKSFGPVRALRGVTLTVARGEALAIFGPNGAGKTTLLKIASTLMRPSSGQVLLFGADPNQAPHLRRLIGMVSHHSYLYPGLTGLENLLFTARLYGCSDAEARAEAMLAAVGLAGRGGDLVRTYSRGMTQRLSIARALVHDPQILLLDEPYTGLDRSSAAAFTELLMAMRGSRAPIAWPSSWTAWWRMRRVTARATSGPSSASTPSASGCRRERARRGAPAPVEGSPPRAAH